MIGYNEGSVSITDKTKIGVTGSLTVTDEVSLDNKSSQTYIGGLVGQNTGTITGSVDVNEDLSSGQSFVHSSFEDSGAITSVDITFASVRPNDFWSFGWSSWLQYK